MGKQLHIISFDIPYPADYGGVIDVFYKLKSLSKAGVEIILHCFQYGDRMPQDELNKYCKEVFYYERVTGLRGLDTTLPYIVSSRRSQELILNIQKYDAPILFEGIHTTYYANHPSLIDRKKMLRSHNIESVYYSELAGNTGNAMKKLYYLFEAGRLQRYEQSLMCLDTILSISENDLIQNKLLFPDMAHDLVPAFHPNDEVCSKEGQGQYCLYHGNLSVAENIRSVQYLVSHIFSKIEHKLIIAGKNPDASLLALTGKNVEIVANPDASSLHQLIQYAHINVLPSFQQTGLKLKLLNALFAGRHCILNQASEQVLNQTLHMASTDELFCRKINELMVMPFTTKDIDVRKEALLQYDNDLNARKIVEVML